MDAGSIGAGLIGAGLLGRLFMSGRCIRRGPVVVDGLGAEARHGFPTGAAGVGGQQQNPARPDQAGLGERLPVWLLAAVVEREDLAVSQRVAQVPAGDVPQGVVVPPVRRLDPVPDVRPSAHLVARWDVLHHEVVPASPGIKGGTNSPDAEVQRVVELVIEHAHSRPDQTLGVITFGIPHTRRIEAALEAKFAADPKLEQILSADEREPFFVKNIERVQGDERDAIILSVGYGKTAEGKLNLFWGPMLKPGGERRLNVAISRARARLVLVTSFRADDVAEDAHASAGFKLM